MCSAKNFLPANMNLPALRKAAAQCQACHLYVNAKQTVFGLGSERARLLVVGEIPGKKEDDVGKPFVGPAGLLLREALVKNNLDEKEIYFTNVVKHFKFTYINNKKIHQTPTRSEINACVPWLEAEIITIQPRIILSLGAIAARALLNRNIKITQSRGNWFDYSPTIKIMLTFHPSAILRVPNEIARQNMKKVFMEDIKKVADFYWLIC